MPDDERGAPTTSRGAPAINHQQATAALRHDDGATTNRGQTMLEGEDAGDVRGRQLSFLADPLDVEFLEFHHAHPEVAEALSQLALAWRERGHDRVGIAMLFEMLRWLAGHDLNDLDAMVRVLADVRRTWPAGRGAPALNNSMRSRFARYLAASDPRLASMFELRSLAADRGAA